MDAGQGNKVSQFLPRNMLRDIHKVPQSPAHPPFSFPLTLCFKLYFALKEYPKVDGSEQSTAAFATGHWGGGAFQLDKQCKVLGRHCIGVDCRSLNGFIQAIQQWIAASESGLEMHYFTFQVRNFAEEFALLMAKLKEFGIDTVGKLTNLLLQAVQQHVQEGIPVFDCMLLALRYAPLLRCARTRIWQFFMQVIGVTPPMIWICLSGDRMEIEAGRCLSISSFCNVEFNILDKPKWVDSTQFQAAVCRTHIVLPTFFFWAIFDLFQTLAQSAVLTLELATMRF